MELEEGIIFDLVVVVLFQAFGYHSLVPRRSGRGLVTRLLVTVAVLSISAVFLLQSFIKELLQKSLTVKPVSA